LYTRLDSVFFSHFYVIFFSIMRLLSFYYFYIFLILSCAFCSCGNSSNPLAGKKILVFIKNGEGFVHDNIQASIDMFINLSKNEKFEVDITDNASVFSSSELQKYDIVVFCNTNNKVFDNQAEKDGLMKFVRLGKGFMGVHIACGTERDWEWYIQMLGGTFDFHPAFQEFPVLVVDNKHPSISGIPSPWILKEELYVMKNLNPAIHILMVSDFSSPYFKSSQPMPETFGKVFPCVWTNNYDGGHQWFTALGHDKGCYSDPVFKKHILGGLVWLAKL